METPKVGVVIVAGGRGVRMGLSVPKQFVDLSERRCVLEVTVEKFAHALPDARITVVLPSDSIGLWREINRRHEFGVRHAVVAGGDDRCGSVRNGIMSLEGVDVIAVSDGVRPFVSEEMIRRAVNHAAEHGSAVCCTPVTDTVRMKRDGGSVPVDRELLFAVQTPQVFDAELLKAAYAETGDGRGFTDDASVVEAYGGKVEYIPGERSNIKLTTPEDISLAKALYALESQCR